MTLRTRVTVDVDPVGSWRLRAIRAYHTLERCCSEVETRVSASGTGIHLIGYVTDEDDVSDVHRLRRHLADDHDRLHLDGLRARLGHHTNVLWTDKDGESIEEGWTSVYDAIAHIDAQRLSENFGSRVRLGLVR